ncbi:ankyrin repeat-containing protein NPR4-like isoform X2 [Jatropha curcas]|uniref:ankyrin repeat-containing protein NPR4-like isoform X1 n=1 Tax=Jatropha curcas TaxID=180498 RepID=UPI0018930A4D|nr:ankyrin repeat-containing protein NPR4-like isoform X1 [Jatropha curcas]XP_037494571.1 ankyrin repeat-containing protein NPR4-like isoform X2 [Jatropha curcas]
MLLVEKNPKLTQATNDHNQVPLCDAAQYGHKETVSFLLSATKDEYPSPFAGESGVQLVRYLIIADFYDIAIDVLNRYPALAREGQGGSTALYALTEKSKVFANGSRLGYCGTLLYHFCPDFVGFYANRETVPGDGDIENQKGRIRENNKELKQFQFLHRIQNTVLMNKQAKELLKLLISEVRKAGVKQADKILGPASRRAARSGNQEFVIEVIKAYPQVLWLSNKDDGLTIFHLAVQYRQERIFNLLYQMGTHKHFLTALHDKSDNNMLHLAGELQPSTRISGAAFQMQRELQWFKEVENVVQPSYKEEKNKEDKTPREVFTEKHKDLVERGEKWMKGTATSCATVAALVLTVVFAAAFTVPGGNSDKGIPIYLSQKSFMSYAISDVLALFCSITSLLIFLGMITSRYAEEDFFKALPMRLIAGLITLCFSIGFMLGVFGDAFLLELSHKVQWIAALIAAVICITNLFVPMRFPLLGEIVYSTFGPSIFGKQSEEVVF